MSEALCECVFDCRLLPPPPPSASRTAGPIAGERAASTETGKGAGDEMDIKETEEEEAAAAVEEVEEEETLEAAGRTVQAGTK